jgi:hypothetical protein
MADPNDRIELECRAWEGARVDVEALAVNGFALERVHDKALMSEKEMIEIAVQWIIKRDCKVLIGKSPGFDRSFLLAAWIRAGHSRKEFPLSYRVADVHSMAIPILLGMGHRMPPSGFSSEQIRVLLGLPTEPKPHRAMTGARMAYEALIAELLLLTDGIRRSSSAS